MTEKPNLNAARLSAKAWVDAADLSAARAWVDEAVATVWTNARVAIQHAECVVDPPMGTYRITLKDLDRAVAGVRVWHYNLVNGTGLDGKATQLAVARVMESDEGRNAVEAAEEGLAVAEQALAWARENSVVKA